MDSLGNERGLPRDSEKTHMIPLTSILRVMKKEVVIKALAFVYFVLGSPSLTLARQ